MHVYESSKPWIFQHQRRYNLASEIATNSFHLGPNLIRSYHYLLVSQSEKFTEKEWQKEMEKEQTHLKRFISYINKKYVSNLFTIKNGCSTAMLCAIPKSAILNHNQNLQKAPNFCYISVTSKSDIFFKEKYILYHYQCS